MVDNARGLDSKQLWEANKDCLHRMKSEGVDIVYDAPLDTLFVEIGGPKEALSEHVGTPNQAAPKPITLHGLRRQVNSPDSRSSRTYTGSSPRSHPVS